MMPGAGVTVGRAGIRFDQSDVGLRSQDRTRLVRNVITFPDSSP